MTAREGEAQHRRQRAPNSTSLTDLAIEIVRDDPETSDGKLLRALGGASPGRRRAAGSLPEGTGQPRHRDRAQLHRSRRNREPTSLLRNLQPGPWSSFRPASVSLRLTRRRSSRCAPSPTPPPGHHPAIWSGEARLLYFPHRVHGHVHQLDHDRTDPALSASETFIESGGKLDGGAGQSDDVAVGHLKILRGKLWEAEEPNPSPASATGKGRGIFLFGLWHGFRLMPWPVVPPPLK